MPSRTTDNEDSAMKDIVRRWKELQEDVPTRNILVLVVIEEGKRSPELGVK